jgi:hypothetical protein
MSLLLHCGAGAITRDQLAGMPVPMPIGPNHETRPFIEDVELVLESLEGLGLRVRDESYGVRTRQIGEFSVPTQFFGLLELGDEGDFALMVGLRGSYDQSLPRGIAVGSRVFVCDNLAFSGEVDLHTRQTSNIDTRMPRLVARACERVPELAGRQSQRFGRYRRARLTLEEGDQVIAKLYRAGVLGARSLHTALDEWAIPSRSEFSHEKNLWGLHNAITESLKGDGKSPTVLSNWKRTLGMTEILDQIA